MRLAEDAGLREVVADKVRLPGDAGSNPAGKVATIVAGMAAGADLNRPGDLGDSDHCTPAGATGTLC